jgi:hypothetical protein
MRDDEAAAIARRLTPAMRESLCRRPSALWWHGPPACLPWSLTTEAALMRRFLLNPYTGTRARPLTPLGLRVRALLEQEVGDAPA